MKIYLGYPESFTENSSFKIKDNFLKEINVDYKTVPIEVKKKLLGTLNFLKEKNYIFIDEINYDASDILEFSLFSLKPEKVETVIIPGYLYGKSTFIIRETFKNVFDSEPKILYDFNFFKSETVVINIGYRETSISIGGNFLTVIDVGEFDFVDIFGNYLFNRFLKEKKLSNVDLRKNGKRGIYLDKLRGEGAKILFERADTVKVEEENYERKIENREIELALSILTGKSNFGEFINQISDISSAVIEALYTYEIENREKPKIKEIVIIGRTGKLLTPVFKKIFGIKPRAVTPSRFTKAETENTISKLTYKRILLNGKVEKEIEIKSNYDIENLPFENLLILVRKTFRERKNSGVKIIEKIAEIPLSNEEKERFIGELLNIVRIVSFKDKQLIPYLDYSIAALSKLEIPENLFPKVESFISQIAFRWSIPLKTRMNILYFIYKNREKIKEKEWLKILLPLTATWIRDKNLTEGERQFIRSVINI